VTVAAAARVGDWACASRPAQRAEGLGGVRNEGEPGGLTLGWRWVAGGRRGSLLGCCGLLWAAAVVGLGGDQEGVRSAASVPPSLSHASATRGPAAKCTASIGLHGPLFCFY
jgi:hypothetical protein